MPRFLSLVLDADSTLSGIEGIDWLAARRSPEVARQIARFTDDAMTGRRTLNEVYGARLGVVKPTRAELGMLAEAYWENAAPGAAEAIVRITAAGVRIDVVTSGFQLAVAPFAKRLGVPEERVHGVHLDFDAQGRYSSFDPGVPLAIQGGKRIVVEALRLEQPSLAVGDGMTDAEIRPAASAFAAFTGFVRRDPVVAISDFTAESFADIERLVLGTGGGQ